MTDKPDKTAWMQLLLESIMLAQDMATPPQGRTTPVAARSPVFVRPDAGKMAAVCGVCHPRTRGFLQLSELHQHPDIIYERVCS